MASASSACRGLENEDRVAIVGGGPAGSFFAIHLLREARRRQRRFDVVLIERRSLAGSDGMQYRGCNFCAGVISPRMNEVLDQMDMVVQDEIIQSHIDYVWIQGQWKNFRLRVPKDMKMYSVFRGSLPGRRSGECSGFDAFLLDEAVKQGARILSGEVQSITRAASGRPVLTVKQPSGMLSLDAGFVTIAAGINAHCGTDYCNDELIASVRALNPRFVPSRSRRAFLFELDVGEDYVERHLHREIYFVEGGSQRLQLEHAAILPKGRFLTVAMIGKCIDEAVLPRDSRLMVRDFFKLPQIAGILPEIEAAPIACACAPRMTATTAASPFGDQFAIIGDAVGSRLNKDGLFSAHMTALALARAVLHDGIDQQALARNYGAAIQRLAADNRLGKIVFGLSRVAFTHPVVSRVTYQAFATEYKVRDERLRPLTAVLWKIASGTADYREVLREMFGVGVLRSLVVGGLVTLRNVACELLFGLKWGEYGRYPTVVLKERREAVKRVLQSSLGIELGQSPEFEQMYVIKIRGSADEIMEELAQFGSPDAAFLNLRFLKVRQIEGTPNQVGSVIRYRVPWFRSGARLRLTRKIVSQTLLYEFDEHLAHQGKLILSVGPTKDRNSRLSVYAAFDFKRGQSLAGCIFWRAVRALFPGFAHDVVWNHAMCTIKEAVERKRSLHAAGAGR